MERLRGFTLVELVVFIVILGLAGYALFRSFGNVLPRSPTAGQLTQATQLAQERMELILAQRDVQSYNNLVDLDPCNRGGALPAVCTNGLGYTVSSQGTAAAVGSWIAWGVNPTANYKLVTVTVALGGTTLATQSTVLSNYLP
jgi:type II secretory pathway pseudopilin PulG